MSEHNKGSGSKAHSLIKNLTEKIHGDDSSSSSSSSNSDAEKKPEASSSSTGQSLPPLWEKETCSSGFPRRKTFGDLIFSCGGAKKISASVLGGATAIWIFFELLEYHLLTLLCHILKLSLAVLFLWSNATTFINKYSPLIPAVSLTEDPFLQVSAGFWVLSIVGVAFVLLHTVPLLYEKYENRVDPSAEKGNECNREAVCTV